jgi:Tfp pilus assembly protein PilF
MINHVLRLAIVVLSLTVCYAGTARCEDATEQQQIKLLMTSYDAGNYTQARDLALLAISKNRSNLTAHYLLGNTYTKLGAHELMVAKIRESTDAKIQPLKDAFEVEKKRITEMYDRQAKDFEASQR